MLQLYLNKCYRAKGISYYYYLLIPSSSCLPACYFIFFSPFFCKCVLTSNPLQWSGVNPWNKFPSIYRRSINDFTYWLPAIHLWALATLPIAFSSFSFNASCIQTPMQNCQKYKTISLCCLLNSELEVSFSCSELTSAVFLYHVYNEK